MSHVPKRARTLESGACSHCVKQRSRCYIGVRGIPCSNCRRSNIRCDGVASQEVQVKKQIPSRVYCDEALFESQIRRAEQEQSPPPNRLTAPVTAADPLENYVSIIQQLFGPEPLDPPTTINQPRYVSELPKNLEPSDVQYLEAHGALCLPTGSFRKQLLKSYILWVHPQLPMLDLERFLCTIAENDGKNCISLLLFHTVMFAASAFVDISHIQNEGYTSRKEARYVLFQRVKVLLEINCEDDPLATVQALLLLTHWNDLPHAEKDAIHWIGICLSLAISIGLHRDPDSMLPLSDQRVWRRTWWSVHNHTRLTAANLLSVVRLQEQDEDKPRYDMPMITLNDFEFRTFSSEARGVVDDCEVLHNIEYQKTQALVFIQKTRLCRVSRFSIISNRLKKVVRGEAIPDTEMYSNVAPTPDETEELRRWLFQLPRATIPHCPSDLVPTECERSIYLHQAWLRLLYLGSMYAVGCDESQQLGDAFVEPVASSQTKVGQILLDMTDLFDEIDSLDLSEQLPCLASALLILVLIFHRQLLQNGMQNEKTLSSRSLHKCWNVVRKLVGTSDLAHRMTIAVGNTTCADLWEMLSSTNSSCERPSQPPVRKRRRGE